MPKSTKQIDAPKTPQITPRVEDEISIVMSCDDDYAMYAAVTIQSVLSHAISGNYTVYILGENLSEYAKNNLLDMATDHVHINYVDVKQYMAQYPTELFYTDSHYSLAIYYRLFIPSIFQHFKKVIYCDCDAVFVKDPALLYHIDLTDKLVAAVTDPGRVYQIYRGDTYCSEFLQLKNPLNYFQTGLLVFHIPLMREFDFTRKCLDALKRLKTPTLPDQDVMNIVCEGRVAFLNMAWNALATLLSWYPDFERQVPAEMVQECKKALEDPYFIHWGGKEKPWKDMFLQKEKIWWHYARQTPFYEQILVKYLNFLTQHKQAYAQLSRQYARCRFLARFTWGKRHRHYVEKASCLLRQLQHIEPLL